MRRKYNCNNCPRRKSDECGGNYFGVELAKKIFSVEI